MDSLNFTSPLAQQQPAPPKPFSSPPSGFSAAAPVHAPVEASPEVTNMNLGFDIGASDQQIAPEQKKAMEFEAIMERFKNVITTEQKLLAYDFADKIGVVDLIEQFYEYLAIPDKDGIISYKGDEVKINKTKIMGALMLGDNTMLDRAMSRFHMWLIKALK
jgi:hypothetical protein